MNSHIGIISGGFSYILVSVETDRNFMKKKPYLLVGTILMIAAAVVPMLQDTRRDASGSARARDLPCVVLDAGHGGSSLR